MWCATTRCHHFIKRSTFYLSNGDVIPVLSVRNLGAYLDKGMAMSSRLRKWIGWSARHSTSFDGSWPFDDQFWHPLQYNSSTVLLCLVSIIVTQSSGRPLSWPVGLHTIYFQLRSADNLLTWKVRPRYAVSEGPASLPSGSSESAIQMLFIDVQGAQWTGSFIDIQLLHKRRWYSAARNTTFSNTATSLFLDPK